VKQELKAVNFYRLALLKGCYSGMKATREHRLALSGEAGAYITPMFDTQEAQCSYNRLVVDGRFEGAKLELIAAATDETDVFIEGKPQCLEEYLANGQVPAPKKAEALRQLPHVRAVNTRDILLHDLKGRYVWVFVALYPTGKCDCELEGLRVELPKYSFSEYFPEIYQGNDFFDRYIAVFQSMFLDMERQVDNVPRLLDYRTTPDENVEYLAGWLGIDNSRHLFTTGQLRHIIENIDVFQGSKGTKRALEQIILLLTGIRPRIVEHFRWQRPVFTSARIQANKALYGETGSHFCVILDLTRAQLPEKIGEKDLEWLIESYSVMGLQFKVVYLRMCSHTDTHCYLDVNGALSIPEIAGLEVGAFGEHITIG